MKKAPITAEQDDIMKFIHRMGVKTQGTIFSQDKKVIFVEEGNIPLEGKPLMTAETNDTPLKPRVILDH